MHGRDDTDDLAFMRGQQQPLSDRVLVREITARKRLIDYCDRRPVVIVMSVEAAAADHRRAHGSEEIGTRPAEVRHELTVWTHWPAVNVEAHPVVLLAEREDIGETRGIDSRNCLDAIENLVEKVANLPAGFVLG